MALPICTTVGMYGCWHCGILILDGFIQQLHIQCMPYGTNKAVNLLMSSLIVVKELLMALLIT